MNIGQAPRALAPGLLLILVVAGQLFSSPAQSKAPKAEFKKTSKDFGLIKQGEVVSHEFTFWNSGNEVFGG